MSALSPIVSDFYPQLKLIAMHFDNNNKIVKLCAEGMDLEGQGRPDDARKHFQQAWDEASTNFEKFVSAHYVARQQQNTEDKLTWDKIALDLALKTGDENVKGAYPSLYLNIGKCYEDLNDMLNASANYHLANSFIHFLKEDGYGNMIKRGIANGIERVKQNQQS